MSKLNVAGVVLGVLSVGIWGAIYLQSGATTFANMILLIGIALSATCFSLAWAESYTS